MNQSLSNVAMQFDAADQQRSAATFGMWIFLTTEVLFFGGMFAAYAVYRCQYPDAFVLGSRHVNLWIGGAMTLILLTGSLLVAMSDHLLEHSDTTEVDDRSTEHLRLTIFRRLVLTAMFGMAFLSCEFCEYYGLIEDGMLPGAHFTNTLFPQLPFAGGAAQIFFSLFFCMTGLHMLHMIIGVGLVSGLALAVRRSQQPLCLRSSLKVIGLYWHFVDIVWLFLYPLFYLVR